MSPLPFGSPAGLCKTSKCFAVSDIDSYLLKPMGARQAPYYQYLTGGVGGLTFVFRIARQPCASLFVHTREMKLKIPSVKFFRKCPVIRPTQALGPTRNTQENTLSRAFSDDECTGTSRPSPWPWRVVSDLQSIC